MTGTPNAITPQRYSQGFTYDAYVAQMTGDRESFQKSAAGFKLSQSDAVVFKGVVLRLGGVKALAIVEDWCPDVHRGLPVIAAIAQASGMELRVFYRDKNPDIMDLYLKEGKYQSIPVFAFLDMDMKPLCHFIERPSLATEFIAEMAAELTKKKLSEEELRVERRQRIAPMAEDWRQDTVVELKALLGKAAAER